MPAIQEGHYQCPCCDFYTLVERASYQPCPVCYWEDDGQSLDELDRVSGTNHITLREGRRNFVNLGACDQAALSLVAPAEDLSGVRREVRATV
ncbi:MAG: CPCC family cysteine-rich protein [Planctomycetota bacterium]|nr:CPCC family cysteine-rich protein [Planctomycetota bacterium]